MKINPQMHYKNMTYSGKKENIRKVKSIVYKAKNSCFKQKLLQWPNSLYWKNVTNVLNLCKQLNYKLTYYKWKTS